MGLNKKWSLVQGAKVYLSLKFVVTYKKIITLDIYLGLRLG
jgi:hypothetical protein